MLDESAKNGNEMHNNSITAGNMVGVLAIILVIGYKKIIIDNGVNRMNENL
jgi:hypothetical protein